MEFHEVANLFPMMSVEEFDALVEDIRANGLRESIWTHEGKIIDGRNRYQACLQAGVSPRFRTWDGNGSLVQFVVSLNLKRRHLSSSQKAMVAVNMLPLLEAEARKRQAHGNTAPGRPFENKPTDTVKLRAELQGEATPLPEPNQKTSPVPTLPQKIEEAFERKKYEGEATHQAAQMVGTNRQYVSDAKKIADKAPELVQPVLSGEINIPEAKRIAELPPAQRAEAIQKPHVAHNSGNNEWYTPQEYIEAARSVLGDIDLDPATSETANGIVKAHEIYTAEDDGLAKDWRGRVWMNPPYAQPLIWQFCDKLATGVLQGNVTEAIVLVNNGTETAWFHRLAEASTAICFPKGRIKFWAPNKETAAPLQGQAVFYMGQQVDLFAEKFRQFGLVVRT